MTAGWVALRMTRRGLSVFTSRIWVFAGCALATTMTTAVPFLPSGPLLVGALLIVAFGALGCFASYYSLTQDLSTAHQGKVSGSLATCTWLVTATFHKLFGIFLDQAETISQRIIKYEIAIGVMGWLPMISLVALLLLWNRGQTPAAEPLRPASVPEPSI